MNKKITAFIIAVFLLFSCGFTVFAIYDSSLGDWISHGVNIDSDFEDIPFSDWDQMSVDERRNIFEHVVSTYGRTPHFTNDFLSDSVTSHQCYEGFINGFSVAGGPFAHLSSEIYLEKMGQADFGLGFYDSNDNYADGTVADTLNDEFLDYIQKVPYSGESASTAYRFSNGYYVDWDPLLLGSGPNSFGVSGSSPHSATRYGLRFYLHDETGLIIDMVDHKGYNNYTPLLVCDSCGGGLFNNFTITSDGQYYFDCYPWKIPHPSSYVAEKSPNYAFPWWSLYGAPTEDIINNDPVAVGNDENGNQIQLNINSDGVTYEGSTYNYNSDNSVTINGNTYYLTVKPDSVNDDYYNDFLSDTINNYYYYYTTNEKPFDGTDIISSLKSIFSSLEAFRGDFFTKIKQVLNQITDGFNGLSRTISLWGNKITSAINSLRDDSDLSEEQLAEYQKKLETAVNSRFGAFLSLQELVENALSSYQNSNTSQITFKIKGFSYTIDFSKWFNDDNMKSIRFLMAAFIYVSFALNTFRRIPSYIYNGGDR